MKRKGKIQRDKSEPHGPKISICGLSLLFLTFYFLIFNWPAFAQLVRSVEAVGVTVSDMDRSVEFFSKVLSFEKVSDTEVWGPDYERLQGLFGMRARIVGMRLGGETIE